MSDDDLSWSQPADDPTRPERPAKTCRRHRWTIKTVPRFDNDPDIFYYCLFCGRVKDEAASRRGRTNRQRGNREELTVARKIGGRKMGPLGLPWDVETATMRLQVKKLATWPSIKAVLDWMDTIPIGRDMRGVVLVQPGRGGRQVLVLDLKEFAQWYGDPTKGAADV